MISFLKFRVWDWLLCVCISLGVVLHLYSGFVLDDVLSQSVPLTAGFLAVVTAFAVVCSYTRTTSVIGGAVALVIVVALVATTRFNGFFVDETTNSLVVAVTLCILTPTVVFFASRTKPGLVVLFVVGTFICSAAAFLQFPFVPWAFVLFLVATAIMFWWRNYSRTLLQAKTGEIRIGRYLTQSVSLVLASLLVTSGIFYGIIEPLDLPTQELKLITRLLRMDTLSVIGVSDVRHILDPNLDSSSDPSDDSTTDEDNQNTEDGERGDSQANTESEDSDLIQDTAPSSSTVINYDLARFAIPILLIVIALAVIAIFVARYLRRRRWWNQVGQLDPENQVVNLYDYICRRLRICGYKKPDGLTLKEFAAAKRHEFEPFAVTMPSAGGEGGAPDVEARPEPVKADGADEAAAVGDSAPGASAASGGADASDAADSAKASDTADAANASDSRQVTFADVTDVYTSTLYGRHRVSQSDLSAVTAFARSLLRNLRKEIGFFRYALRFFRL